MTAENPMRMLESSDAGRWASAKDAVPFVPHVNTIAAEDLVLLLKNNKLLGDQRKMLPNRSGSAPPSMEGSFEAFDSVINQQPSSLLLSGALQNFHSEEQLQADPSYLAYYTSNVNLNPRLPPPIISREDTHLLQHAGAFDSNLSIKSSDDSGNRSLHSTHEEEPEDESSHQQASDDRTEHSTPVMRRRKLGSFASRHKSLVDRIQEDFPRTPSPIYNQSGSLSHDKIEEQIDRDIQALTLNSLPLKISKLPHSKSGPDFHGEVATAHSSLATDDPSATSLPMNSLTDALKNLSSLQKDEIINTDACLDNDVPIGGVAAASGTCLMMEHGNSKLQARYSEKNSRQQQHLFPQRHTPYQAHGSQAQVTDQEVNNIQNGMGKYPHGDLKISVEGPRVLQAPANSPPFFPTAAGYMTSGNPYYPNFDPSGLYASQYALGGYAMGSMFLPPFLAGLSSHAGIPPEFDATSGQIITGENSAFPTGENTPQMGDLHYGNKFYGQHGSMVHHSFLNSPHQQYFQHHFGDAYSSLGQYGRFPATGVIGGQYDPLLAQRDINIAASSDQGIQPLPKGKLSIQHPTEMGVLGSMYHRNPTGQGFVPQIPASPLGSPVLPGSPVRGAYPSGRKNENRFSQGPIQNFGVHSRWKGQRITDSFPDPKKHSFLEELKLSNARHIQLSDIAGNIIELSVDQHGSRFIQQKLENCSVEEKASVFEEVLPQASKLMTDVFGNYVIQKFFEYGTHEQRKELANQLSGQMLQLSLQMYGCRVIQKALEVIEHAQKADLVHELDGHVTLCIRDQNGNHVIQKCIQCMPTEKIGFITSAFKGQVATLSTHPYGCRVIQRILEHCSDEQSQCIVDEILESAYMLVQDQYGNYVTQHVLERGNQRDRSQIIAKLTGKIVQMSQHKYASNVVEKCLEHGDATEREILIDEIISQSEENDNLLMMMKDQFANYVVQKALDTSNDQQRELLLDKIRVHVHALKKYTYGKHIVARFEQLTSEEKGDT